jgi:hypothetical protein
MPIAVYSKYSDSMSIAGRNVYGVDYCVHRAAEENF